MVLNQPCFGSVIGFDIGSVTLSIVQLDMSGKLLNHAYVFHKGQIKETLKSLQHQFDLTNLQGIASSSSLFQNPNLNPNLNPNPNLFYYNPQVCLITAVRKLFKEPVSILMVGAEKFMLINFDDKGNYLNTKTNSSCASGTGSFLDQQAFRLNLSGIDELCKTALRNKGDIPDIASRCAVFAKTDLIHAQQKGYSIEAICDSLCKGLAKNITDTLFHDTIPEMPVLFCGGVSKNDAVRLHIEQQLNIKLLHHEYSHVLGSIGAALMFIKNSKDVACNVSTIGGGCTFFTSKELSDLFGLNDNLHTSEYFYKPLSLKLSDYPDFNSYENYNFKPVISEHTNHVEVDIYQELKKYKEYNAILGIDIGSTSTKAILIDELKLPLAGLYTYTAGNPLNAVKAIFETIVELINNKQFKLNIQSVGTTGSGRKFIGKIIRANLIVDEITSHARAAYEINPATDTIIEIGGQDAKFTMMQNGVVTFSQMNSVCAAGTGSFIEEQSKKLNCKLSEVSSKAEGVKAPMASERCTVFMERDINNYINEGYSIPEILATVLHSVRENYLKKVAIEASIGDNISFQGATARNKSLVAAFEQRLNKKIFVSKYCHLTGALGTALILHDEQVKTLHATSLQMATSPHFRGLELYKETIPITNETCQICTNYCKLNVAEVQGEKVANGFLCGRDYDTAHKVKKNNSEYDLIDYRNKIFNTETLSNQNNNLSVISKLLRSTVNDQLSTINYKRSTTIGLPASLHMFDELELWKRFFHNLHIKTISSENYKLPVSAGKRVAGAEFCAPIESVFGHVLYLASKADYIFLPVFLESRQKPKNADRNYCYYTQFSSALVNTIKEKQITERCLSPFLNFSKGKLTVINQLYKCLKTVFKSDINILDVVTAYDEALSFYNKQKQQLLVETLHAMSLQGKNDDISVVLMGRPYVVLSKSMNKGIPDIFSGMGIKTLFQDMIPPSIDSTPEMDYLLKSFPWNYASKILDVTKTIATTKNLYPVLITAFKCSPDSFMIDYFRKILDEYKKPYLILQVDDHDSNTGYETRIEAAIRSFKSHAQNVSHLENVKHLNILPAPVTKINNKILLFPNWDTIVAPLVVANLKRSGIDARLLKSDESIIRKSMAYNTGQCLPVNIITREFIEYVEANDLNPEHTMLWMASGRGSCNLRMFPHYIETVLQSYGKGFDKAKVYVGDISHKEISVRTTYYAYFAYMLGGLIRKLGCKIRPYELNKGETNEAIKNSIAILEKAFLGELPLEASVKEAVNLFENIKCDTFNEPMGGNVSHFNNVKHLKPKVAIFGDLYVRDNDIMNQGLIAAIEDAGGEVITTPYTDYVRIIKDNVLRRSMNRGDYLETGFYKLILASSEPLDKKYYKYFEKYLGRQPVIDSKRLEQNLAKFNIGLYHHGESYENILKIFYLIENYPDISLFVQTNPSFCCPSLVTEAMTSDIKRITGIPVVTITYDGTSDYKNDIIVPYLQMNKKVNDLAQ